MISVYDGFRAAALLVGFAAGVRDKKSPFTADMIFSTWVAVLLFTCPGCIAEKVNYFLVFNN